jgi:hypothetical protein
LEGSGGKNKKNHEYLVPLTQRAIDILLEMKKLTVQENTFLYQEPKIIWKNI